MLAVPTKIGPFLRSRLFSWPGKLRMGLDLVIPGGERPRRRVDRVLPAPSLRPGVGRAPGRAAARRDPRRRPRAALDPRDVPALPRPRGEATAASCAGCGRRRGRDAPAGEKPPAAFYSLRCGLRELVDALVLRLDARARCVTKLPVRRHRAQRQRLRARARPPGDARGRARDRRRARTADRAGAEGLVPERPRAARGDPVRVLGHGADRLPPRGRGAPAERLRHGGAADRGPAHDGAELRLDEVPVPRAGGPRAAARLPRGRARRRGPAPDATRRWWTR